MPMRRTARTCPAQETESISTETAAAMETEPMRCWPHPIVAVPSGGTCPTRNNEDLSQVLERLDCQNQLLCDLLGAVNSLTAALLCREGRN